MRRILPTVILSAAVLIDTLLCGLAAGAVLISTGVAFYQGWAGITISTVTAVTQVALAGGPTYLPPPTYTVLPTYTPYPTYTPEAAALQMQAVTPYPGAELDAGLTPTANALPAVDGQAVTYVVLEGDTLESIADDFGVAPEEIINANGLSPENPVINVGDVLTIPTAAQLAGTEAAPQSTATLAAPQAPTNTLPSNPTATSPAELATPTPSPSPTTDQYPFPTNNSSYPSPTIYP